MLTPNHFAKENRGQNPNLRNAFPWKRESPRLWSVWEMLKTYAKDFVNVVLGLSTLQEELHFESGAMSQEQLFGKLAQLQDRLAIIKEYSLTFELKAALNRVRDIELQLLKPEEAGMDDLIANIKELQRDVIEALDGEKFLYVSPTKADFWENEEHFGSAVTEKIDAARTDIREACSCFAVGRYTATVYHCIGIMQAALVKLAQRISSERIDLEVDDSSDAERWAEWKRLEPKYNEIISDANAVSED